jgi:alkaline phosphatase
VTTSSNFIWRQIEDGGMTIDEAMATYASMTNLTCEEMTMITSVFGVADVIIGRAHVGWAYPCDGIELSAQHTGVMAPVYSYGPGTEGLGGLVDNTDIALAMFDVIG